MEQYITIGKYTKELLTEISRYAVNRRQIMLFRIFILISLGNALLMLSARNLIVAAASLLCAAAFSIQYFMLPKTLVSHLMKQIRETYHDDYIPYRVAFSESGASISNMITGVNKTFGYSDISRIYETANAFLFLTRRGQFFIAFKDGFQTGSAEKFPEYLGKKCPQVKIRRKIK